MTHEVRDAPLPPRLYPHLEFPEEGGGEDTAQLSSPLAYVFGLDVHGLLFFGHSFACNTTDGA
jgi:hypothetical protein